MYTISTSVGEQGQNSNAVDIRLIQMLLNRIPSVKGGSNPKLVADGLIGPKTIAAIRNFQTVQELPVADGRVDPDGSAIKRLNDLLAAPPDGLVPVSGLPDPTIPLDPGAGGRSIGLSALKPGDIIVSSGATWTGAVIRAVTSSEVSHVMIYLGPDELGAVRVAEAMPPELRYGNLTAANGATLDQEDETHALHEASLAVAFRHQQGISQEQASVLTTFTEAHLGEKYDLKGVILQPLLSLDLGSWCESLGATGAEAAAVVAHTGAILDGLADPLGISVDELFEGLAGSISESALDIAKRCYQWTGQVQVSRESDNSLYCSEFILAVYEAAGITLTSEAPNWSDPEDIVELYWRGRLGYVGHLFS